MVGNTLIYGLRAVQGLLQNAPDSVNLLRCDRRRHDQRMRELLGQALHLGIRVQKVDSDTLIASAAVPAIKESSQRGKATWWYATKPFLTRC